MTGDDTDGESGTGKAGQTGKAELKRCRVETWREALRFHVPLIGRRNRDVSEFSLCIDDELVSVSLELA